MTKKLEIKKQFNEEKQKLFKDKSLLKDAFKFCVRYSLLVEEYIRRILHDYKIEFAIASAGSFSRRELSPHSDIDLMFICRKVDGNESLINKCVTDLWDCGIEVSHTVRDFNDIMKFLSEDLHAFTQFFETRIILGNDDVYLDWNNLITSVLTKEDKINLIKEFFADTKLRHAKYGESSKVLEPNIKFTAGGLRDLQAAEWMYSFKNDLILSNQNETTQTEIFIDSLKHNKSINNKIANRLLNSYKFILSVRNHLHLISPTKSDRLEFASQEKIANLLEYPPVAWHNFMKEYFASASILKLFSRTMMKKFDEEISNPISDFLSIKVDDDFIMKGNRLSLADPDSDVDLSKVLRVFYYRAVRDAVFDENLRSKIIELALQSDDEVKPENTSSTFFRELLRLPKNVGKTISTMNELGVLTAFLSELRELVGFFQPGVYHCYTADEHTIIALANLEKLKDEDSRLGKIFYNIERHDLLYLGVLFHDIAKPISVSGHEIIGAEIASSIMERLGYEQEEINLVRFLVRHHLTMEQVAFRRNLNDPITLDQFAANVPSVEALEMLYLLTFADLSAVSPVVWTQWKSDLLFELYRKTKIMLEDRVSGEQLIYADTLETINGKVKEADESLRQHLEAFDDLTYLQQFSDEEINAHAEEIANGEDTSVFFKEEETYTSITVITEDNESVLARLCGAMSINDLNIHDARIFTRKDGLIIDNFNVTDFRTHRKIEPERYEKIKNDIIASINNQLSINKEFKRVKSKWWRIEDKLFSRKGNVKVLFEKHQKYTIIDIFSPDRLGLLYQVTRKLSELGLSIYFAKISTKGDDVVDSFYVLTQAGRKISPNNFELVKKELTETIEQML
ncbi:uridylyltransferase [hydrocarbon metagenome]|uniref:Uridylyltransferase n=1 Tax=hydrocarbon metagenome TaxID=938273 RepID=A0A0W8FW11_9ZZZZ